jgi:hypothetical protein
VLPEDCPPLTFESRDFESPLCELPLRFFSKASKNFALFSSEFCPLIVNLLRLDSPSRDLAPLIVDIADVLPKF